jgi:hypothetical protein
VRDGGERAPLRPWALRPSLRVRLEEKTAERSASIFWGRAVGEKLHLVKFDRGLF